MEKSRRYAKSHEWARLEDDGSVTIGISAYAVEALTDLVFMQLPDVGSTVTAGESFGEIESVKAVSDLYAPISGKVISVYRNNPATVVGVVIKRFKLTRQFCIYRNYFS